MIERTCVICEFWDAKTSHKDKRNHGLCRINPPVHDGGDYREWSWPVTYDEDWCGKWTSKEPQPAEQLLTCTFCGKGVRHLTCYGDDRACSDCLGVPDESSDTLRFSRLKDLVAAKEK